ncbi:MAG: cache domain-containing protein, partial [Deltaproteobacteria bacterium]|nr:cache domain-containing protein [Deltaproteobacteria bacterium]
MKSARYIRFFEDRTMGFKITVVFLLVILIPMTLLAYISYRVIDSILLSKAHEKVEAGIKAAWTEYYVRAEQMRYGMLQAASQDDIKTAVGRADRAYLGKTMARWKEGRPYVDIWTIVDKSGKVIERLNSDYSGDVLELNGLVAKALAGGTAQVSTEIFTMEMLKLEGAELNDNTAIGKLGQVQGSGEAIAEGVMALTVATPVLDERHRPIGAIITADVINNDIHIPDTVSNKMPGLFISVSQKGMRVSTNISNSDGRSMKNTRLPADILSVLSSGAPVSGEWGMQSVTYYSTFEPIKDNRGVVIGSLDAGISKESLWIIQKANQQIIAVATLVGIAFALFAAFASSYRITRPMNTLKGKLSAFASGDMSTRVEVELVQDTKDEIKTLAYTFNSMMDEVEKRESEKLEH